LVTGAAGYIGSVLVKQLLERGFEVRALDSLRFGGESLLGLLDHDDFEFVKADVRDVEAVRAAMSGVWAVAHLAAIVGDPACKQEPELARSVNLTASKSVYQQAEAAGVERFVFASTCSNYGKMKDGDGLVTEESELRPVSLYAETKVEFERYLLSQARTVTCAPTCLRFSTVYGISPRMRFDLTVNEFTRDLVMGRDLVIFGEHFWRPYCHVRDLARSVVEVLEAQRELVAFEVFNVGDTSENYQKSTIVERIRDLVPDARVEYVHKDEDPRDYRVSFAKIRDVLGFMVTRTVPDGVREIKDILTAGFLSDPYDPKFGNTTAKPQPS
jgi:nucleoside-diphosphate-sugar epimerase